jgi:two-component system sensor histidine kinase DegS
MHNEALAECFTVEIDSDASLPYQQELALYRIVQESVNNALKHAQATHIAVQLIQEPRQLVLVVSDNGRGFDYAHVQQHNKSGLGLKNLEARASLLDASFALSSMPGLGTTLRVVVPLSSGP